MTGYKFFEVECGAAEPVVIELNSSGWIEFHNFDLDTELAAVELGFRPSNCLLLYQSRGDFALELYDIVRDCQSDGQLEYVALLVAIIDEFELASDKYDVMLAAVRCDLTETFKLLYHAGYPAPKNLLQQAQRGRASGWFGTQAMVDYLREQLSEQWLERHTL